MRLGAGGSSLGGADRAPGQAEAGDLPSEVRRTAPPGGRGQSGAGRAAGCVVRWARRPRRGPPPFPSRAWAVRRAAAWCWRTAFVPRWPTRAGWDGGDSSLETGLSGEPWPRRPPYLSLPPPLPPRATATAAFYFDSTLRAGAPQGVGGCWGLLPGSLVQRPAAGGGLAGTQGAHSLRAHTPDRLLRGDTRTRTPERDARSESPDISLQRLSPGPSRTLATRNRTQMPAPPSPTHFQLCFERHTHTFVHTCELTQLWLRGHPRPGDLGHADMHTCSHSKVTQHSGTPPPLLPG